MNEKLMVLKRALKICKIKENGDTCLYVSSSADDWKSKMESDRNRCRTGRTGRSFKSTQKYKVWQQRRMMKFRARTDFLVVKDGTKVSLKGQRGNVVKFHRKF